ncbi:hypothetical protein [Sphingobacterium hungaricum]|uniref:Uncharacterized protein n=1 Tax=Sphingobacterium hungaricum TaxID=2082723 RepID=A0A928UYN7_9SPHI|nr:hypothetical protein [Sphingobacterium hungaricum]MBE8712999.1 hypothetical protein [Sphingobacterium hungaricum]
MQINLTKPASILPILVLLLISISSCNRYYYQPNAVNAPMLSNRNDAKILVSGNGGVGTSSSGDYSSEVINLQASYSPLKYVGLMGNYANYRYDTYEEVPEDGEVDAHANLLEGGIGGYYPIILNEKGFKLVADTYVGYGAGKLNSDVKMNFDRIFIQPGINLTTPFFDAGFAARISGIKYSDFNSNGMLQFYVEQQGLQDITSKRHFFFEPAITLRGGYKFVKGQLQVVRSASLNNLDWKYNDTMFTLGLFISIEEFFKLKK